MNTFGKIFTFTSFGESHGPAIGGVIDGMPAGIAIDIDEIQRELNRRRPGQSTLVTARNEADKINILSGIFEGKTTGTPIAFVINNTDNHSNDYSELREAFRPSHADYTYTAKYGIRDYRGGGRSSARETATRVAAGAFAKQYLAAKGITITAYASQISNIKVDKTYTELNLAEAESNAVRCPDTAAAAKMIDLINSVKAEGDTVGGVVTCIISGAPVGLGEPVYGKLQARLADAMLSINAAKGFDYGMGFDGISSRGSEVIDLYDPTNPFHTLSNHSGGIQGGISNGEDIYFRVAFKPVATLLREIDTLNNAGQAVKLKMRGRHDPCVVPRAVPVVEAMAALVMADAVLLNNCQR